MKQHAAIVIAALMITSIAFAISTTSVSATHTPTVGIDEDLVKDETPMVRIITITNAGPDAINTVRIILPEGFDSEFIAPLVKLSKDGIAYLDATDPNVVILPAGTLIQLVDATLTVPENTPVIIENGVNISWIPVLGMPLTPATLLENLEAKTGGDPTVISITLAGDENFKLAESNEETLDATYFGGSGTYATAPLGGSDTFTTAGAVTAPTTITVTAPANTADFYAELWDIVGPTLLEGPTASSGDDSTLDTVDFTTGVAASTTYTVKITATDETGSYTLADDGDLAGAGGPISVAAPKTITVTAQSSTADFTAELWNADATSRLEGPTTSGGEPFDTVDFTTGVAENTSYTVKITFANELGDYDITDDGTQVGSGGPITVAETGELVRLVADTMAIRTDEGVVLLPEKTLVQLVTGTTFAMNGDENITTVDEVEIPTSDAQGSTFVATAWAETNAIYRVMPGNEVTVDTVPGGTKVVIQAGAVLGVVALTEATLFKNENVYRENGKKLTLDSETVPENQPKDWTQDTDSSTSPSGTYVEWAGELAKGDSLEFPFALTTPAEAEDYTIYVRTKDTKGATVEKTITLTVDNAAPEIEVSVSPEIVKGNTKVTITVESNEPLAEIENVLVAENMAPENTEATFKSVSADKKTWTYTYTTGDNAERDDTANVYVVGAEDLVGHENTESGTFTVDRVAPLMPEIEGFPDAQTNKGAWLLQGTARDNKDDSNEIAEGKVKIRVGTAVNEVTTDKNGYWSYSITLTEGVREVGVRCVDLAGNVGPENAENITYDATAPSITWGAVTGVGYTKDLEDGVQINDSTPTITLTIRDDVLGIDNSPCDCEDDNTGYTVRILNSDLTENTPLTNALMHDNHVLQFENTLATALADNTYYVNVLTGDNLQTENVLIKFVIDTDLPSAPLVDVAYQIESTVNTPVVVKDASRTIIGTTEPRAEIAVYGTVNTTETTLTTTTAGSDGKWTATFTLTAGSTTRIEMSATDEAGNESPSRELYGWMLADASAPTVTLGTLPDTTDKTSITISGTVTKDAWEDWSEITLTVQVGTGDVEVPCVGGSYEYSLSLSEGPNTIVVQATDGIGNPSSVAHATVERMVTPWGLYAIILVIIALVMAAIAIFAGPKIWKR